MDSDRKSIFKNDDGQGLRRYRGYQEALIGAGIPIEEKQVCWIDTEDMKEMLRYDEWILKRLSGCTAAVCYNDEVAYQLVELALRRGIRVPEDLSVVGIDDSYLAGVGRVPLTSFPHPKEQLGRKVASNLMQMLRQPVFDGSCLFGSEPVYRDSVWDLRRQRIYRGPDTAEKDG